MKSIKGLSWKLRLALAGNSLKYLGKLEQWQWLDREQTTILQNTRLARLLSHSFQHVPYYRKALARAKAVNENGVANLEHFDRIPLLDKHLIRANFESLKSDDLNRRELRESLSGGSTGEPIRLIHDRDCSDWAKAIKMLDDLWSGYTIGERRVVLWGSERDLLVGQETIKVRASRWLRNELWLNAFRMTSEQMRKYVEQMNSFRPVQITAYGESIYELSRFVERENLRVWRPRCILTSGGALYKHMRTKIEKVFRAPVFDRYGSREVGDVVCECNCHEGLHVSAPTHYVEILRPDGTPAKPGELGEIVVTVLTNYAMPLIRYRIGDIGSWANGACSCGRGAPLIAEVAGRSTDIFTGREQQRVDGRVFNTFLWDRSFINRYQVIQEDYDWIRILIESCTPVRNPQEAYAHDLSQITENIGAVMGADCRVTFDFVQEMPQTPSGKHRYTLSKLTI